LKNTSINSRLWKYRFPGHLPKRTQQLERVGEKIKEVAEPTGYIQGKTPGSKNEWYAAKALDIMGLTYEYQKPFFGGHMRGGLIMDFVVDKAPLPVPVSIEEEEGHWHDLSMKPEQDLLYSMFEQNYFGKYDKIVKIQAKTLKMALQELSAI
jgi:hypothetical protein